jgi:hypothetical protein
MKAPKPYEPTVTAIELEEQNAMKRYLFEWQVPNPNFNPPNPTRSRLLKRRKTECFVASQGAREYAELMERKLRREYPVDNPVAV